MKTKIALLLSVFLLTIVSCERNTPETKVATDDGSIFMDLSSYYAQSNLKSSNGEELPENIAVLKAEYLTAGESGEIGRTIYFMNVGNKKLSADFVPSLYLSLDNTTDVSYYIDENRPYSDLPVTETTGAIQNAMGTWDAITCSELGMFQVPSDGRPTGFVAALFGYSGSFAYTSDVTHCGWMPGGFFDILAPGGSNYILGVTFTIIFTGSDYDNNKKSDVAWREIYYNDLFPWNIGTTYDVETVALHEAGHGLSQAHFGTAFRDRGTGDLHFSPRAVMNAGYSGIQIDIGRTDNAGHCSIWANWPQR